ncbi:MAG: hypothetical protein PUE13_08240 [Clostridiales bacterium]|nr:hypothetical protein [Clostridiales bacterium]
MVKNFRTLIFFVFLALYGLGVCIGGVRQVKTNAQTEMYEYLTGAVSGYDATAASSIKSVAKDNAVLLVVLAVSGLCRPLSVLAAAAMAAKGYVTGFSITAILRLCGLKGIFLCTANLLSVMLTVPAVAYFGASSAENLFKNRGDRIFYKYYLILLIILTAIFCVDSLARGVFSTIFMKFAASFTKTA